MKKAIITIVGADKVGIIAAVTTYLAEVNVNVLDITQTIMQDLFTMMTIVDITGSKKPFDGLYADLQELGDRLGVKIQIQNSEIFDSMHKI